MHFFSEHQPFLSTPSARRATCAACASICRRGNFYPRPPRGGRPSSNTPNSRTSRFLSTPSARRATCSSKRKPSRSSNFYPRPPRGGRLLSQGRFLAEESISIHALREEGDSLPWPSAPSRGYFYPRPPRGGRLEEFSEGNSSKVISIHALREEGDQLRVLSRTTLLYFYPRPPRGGRLLPNHSTISIVNFYPRPPRGGRPTQLSDYLITTQFLSTPSARRATRWRQHSVQRPVISIHALREEGDRRPSRRTTASGNFYPRPPRGGRPSSNTPNSRTSRFLSTPSARRATCRPLLP